ncbi:hypothetical protein WJ438_40165 [Streptomyces sp. GD-15H]|uniref:hypothetical protein n=1 Tax=Streptomyces sp. GD-15H TaxID=3129112 RepID=UPI0032557BE0
MTDRRPPGTGPTRTATEADTELPPAPRAQLAAERLPATPAAGRRALGAGPAPPRVPGTSAAG